MKKFTRNETKVFLESSKEELFIRIMDALEILEQEQDKNPRITEAVCILKGSDKNYYEDEISIDEV